MSLHSNMPALGRINQQGPQASSHAAQQDPSDIERIRQAYHAALYELTFNSKPIITNLTIMAQENQNAAGAIVREIEQQIKNNAPGQKLPVLYLIDSICKNVGGVYINHFARNIISTYLDAYNLVEPSVRQSFERLLQTWKNGMPNGNPVFPRNIIEPIERAIHFMREQQHHVQDAQPPQSRPTLQQQQPQPPQPLQQQQSPKQQLHPRQPHPPHPQHPQHGQRQFQQPQPPRQKSVRGRDRFQQQRDGSHRHQQVYVNPNFVPLRESRDPRNGKRFTPPAHQDIPPTTQPAYSTNRVKTSPVSAQLHPPSGQPLYPPQATTSSVTSAESVSQLLTQIQPILPSLLAAQGEPAKQQLGQMPSVGPTTTYATSLQHTIASSPSVMPSTVPPVSGQMGVPQGLSYLQPTPTSFPSQPSVPHSQPVVDMPELLKGLTSLGYLNVNKTDSPVSHSVPPGQAQTQSLSQPLTQASEFGPFRLDSKDLQIPRPGAIELLYSKLPLQCKQCGFRYPATSEGQTKMDAHLDAHFRQNRRMKDRVKRDLSRSWLVSEKEWISGATDESTSHQAPTFLNDKGNGSTTHAASGGGTGDNSDSAEKHMIVMPDGDRKPCPICGEGFTNFWNADEEEWMYKNAILISNTVYHATCHADAIKSGILVSGDDETMTDATDQTPLNPKRRMSQEEDKTDAKMARTS